MILRAKIAIHLLLLSYDNNHASLTAQTFESQNGLIEENDGRTTSNNYEHAREQEQLESISNSFDAIVNEIRLSGRHWTENEGLVKDEISIPDTVNVGTVSDTLFSEIRVKGLTHIARQNVNMSWGEDVVSHAVTMLDRLLCEGHR